MNSRVRNILTATAVSLALACPAAAFSQTGENPSETQQQAQATGQGWQIAQHMTHGTVALTQPMDALQTETGSRFDGTLTHSVQLKNGPELPKGTLLVGKVKQDDTQMADQSKVAVRFTEAKLADGQTVPIKATIVEVYPAFGFSRDGHLIPPEELIDAKLTDQKVPNIWAPNVLKVDQFGGLLDLNLHSSVASQNSGVFVSTKTDDVKLMRGTRLEVAIEDANNG